MMKKAGWEEGKGLGRTGDGIVAPIQPAEKFDRTGLGFEKKTSGGEGYVFQRRMHAVDLNREVLHHQDVEFISSPPPTGPLDFSDGLEIERAESPIDYSTYVQRSLVEKLFASKDRFNDVPRNLFLQARYNANPYETIGKSIFQNRAAVKMANLDHLFDLTSARDENGFLTFADICAGPGGFTEYITWRKKLQCRGWGFTLRGESDFALHKFNRDSPTQNFTPIYGADGTGNIFVSDNIRFFADVIARETNNKGVSLVLGDGGFSVEGEENFQELKMRQLILCQFLMALTVLKKGGNFVCKIFDMFTPFTVGILYIMYCLFDRFAIVKPYSSRPANSERYVAFLGLRERYPQTVVRYFFSLNEFFNRPPPGMEIFHIVDPQRIAADQTFVQYVRKSNISILEQQLQAQDEIIKYLEDPGLQPLDQASVRRRCLEEWGLPDERSRKTAGSGVPPPYQPNSAVPLSKREHEDEPSDAECLKRRRAKDEKEESSFVLNSVTLAALEKYKKK